MTTSLSDADDVAGSMNDPESDYDVDDEPGEDDSSSDEFEPSSDGSDSDSDGQSSKRRKTTNKEALKRVAVTLGLDFECNTRKEKIVSDYKVLLDLSSAKTRGALDQYTPSIPFQLLACRLQPTATKRNYFLQSWDVVRVISNELGYSVTEFLNYRGWSFHRDKALKPHLRYHRFEYCMTHNKDQPLNKKEGLIRHFNAMIVNLWLVLKDAYQKIPSSKLRSFEKDFSSEEAFRSKINRHVQVYHLCYAIVLIIFRKHADTLEKGVEDLLHNIFAAQKTRPKIIASLNKILLLFSSEAEIEKIQPLLVNWLKDPSLILRKILNSIPIQSPPMYEQKVTKLVDELLPINDKKWVKPHLKSATESKPPTMQMYRKNVAVVRLQILHLSNQDLKSVHKKKKASIQKIHKSKQLPLSSVQESTEPTSIEDSVETLLPIHHGFAPIVSQLDSSPLEFTMQQPQKVRTDMLTNGTAPNSSRCDPSDAVLEAQTFSGYIYATRDQMNSVSCVLISEPDDYTTRVCQLSPVEVYYHADLKTIKHRVSYLQDEASLLAIGPSRSLHWIPLSNSALSFEFSVIRQDHPLFVKHFSKLTVDLLSIVDFLSECGNTDVGRDGVGNSVGSRYDFGVGNHSFDTNGAKNGKFYDAPHVNCCLEKIQKHKKGASILKSVSLIADAVQLMFDDLMDELGAPKQQDDTFRNATFSHQLSKLVGCQDSRYEWFTILLKCLTAGHIIDGHFDTQNCTAKGYRHTANFSMVVVAKHNRLFRLSLLLNSRSAAGEYGCRENGVKAFLSEIKLYLEQIDKSYQSYQGRTVACGVETLTPTWLHFDRLFFCDQSPWQRFELVNDGVDGIPCVHLIELRAAVTRDLWMSMAADVLRRAGKVIDNPECLMELYLIALYQSGWLYFYVTVEAMVNGGLLESQILVPGAVATLYCRLSLAFFGGFHCGVKPRFSLSNINFQNVYLATPECLQDTLSPAIRALMDVLTWAEVAMGSTAQDLKQRFKEVINQIPGIADFRMQMFLPLCGLSGHLKNNIAIVDIAYTVKGMGSQKSLDDLSIDDDRADKFMALVSGHFDIKPHRKAWIEQILCEKREERIDVMDVFIKGQSLSQFRVDDKGIYRVEVKPYGQHMWERQ
jgi:hypothetical protein